MKTNDTSKKSADGDVATLDTTKPKQDKLLDEAIAETFPASDPISPAYEKSMGAVSLDDEEHAAALARRERLKRAAPYLIGAAGVAVAVALLMRPRYRPMLESVGDAARRLAERAKDSSLAEDVSGAARRVSDRAQDTTEQLVDTVRSWIRR